MRISHGVALAFIAGTATAQLPPEQIHVAGLGAIIESVDVQTPTGNGLCLGVAHLDGHYYVTGGGGGANNTVYVFDEEWTLVRTFPQIAQTAFGWRDPCTDGVSMLWGSEDGIHVTDTLGNQVNTVIAANGPQPIVQPITGAAHAALGLYRALAYDPNGNGGNGSLWTATFGSDLIECDLDGNILTTHPNTPGWSIYGLAWDPYTQTLLCNSLPNAGDIAQIDPATGAIGAVIFRTNPGSAQGGLSPARIGNTWYVVGLDQATLDTVTRYRIHQWIQPFRNGYEEGRLLTAVGANPLDNQPVKIMSPGGTISMQVGEAPEGRRPTWLFFNTGADALINGATKLGNSFQIREFVALTNMSSPTGPFVSVRSISGATVTLPTPMLMDQEFLRVQALTINNDGLAARAASNQMFFQFDASRILVEAEGANSFNADTSEGFFKVHHLFGSPIASVEFDWTTSTNPNQSTMTFDTNQTGMAETLDAGNSADPTCDGTYRNDCDVATGLVYDAMTTPPSSACAVANNANTGYIGTNPTVANSFQTLVFRFAPGQFSGDTFEFDADTDGGQGINGGDMEGMVVRITLEDSTVLVGELAPDPLDKERSFLRFL